MDDEKILLFHMGIFVLVSGAFSCAATRIREHEKSEGDLHDAGRRIG